MITKIVLDNFQQEKVNLSMEGAIWGVKEPLFGLKSQPKQFRFMKSKICHISQKRRGVCDL